MRGEPVYAVYLVYGNEHEASGRRRLEKLAAKLFPGRGLEMVVVDNAMAADREESRGKLTRISGDNSVREFTGYERGIAWLKHRRSASPTAPLLVANDTFHRNYGTEYLRGFTRDRARRAMRHGGILAHVDRYPTPVGLGGKRLQAWARTSLLVARFDTITRLLPLAAPWTDEELFGGEFFRAEAPLDEVYRQYLATWLFEPLRPGLTFRHEWHSKEALTSESRRRLEAKARCILSEHWLSARAAAAGIPLIEARRPFLRRAVGKLVSRLGYERRAE